MLSLPFLSSSSACGCGGDEVSVAHQPTVMSLRVSGVDGVPPPVAGKWGGLLWSRGESVASVCPAVVHLGRVRLVWISLQKCSTSFHVAAVPPFTNSNARLIMIRGWLIAPEIRKTMLSRSVSSPACPRLRHIPLRGRSHSPLTCPASRSCSACSCAGP